MNYLLFALSCISLFMISLLINSKENNIRPLELLVRSISIYLLSVCLLSIIFLLVGHYNIFFIISALAAILIILLILRRFLHQPSIPHPRRKFGFLAAHIGLRETGHCDGCWVVL